MLTNLIKTGMKTKWEFTTWEEFKDKWLSTRTCSPWNTTTWTDSCRWFKNKTHASLSSKLKTYTTLRMRTVLSSRTSALTASFALKDLMKVRQYQEFQPVSTFSTPTVWPLGLSPKLKKTNKDALSATKCWKQNPCAEPSKKTSF